MKIAEILLKSMNIITLWLVINILRWLLIKFDWKGWRKMTSRYNLMTNYKILFDKWKEL